MNSAQRPLYYEIRVQGLLDARWSEWFDSLHLSIDSAGDTTLAGELPDQAALHGVLARIRDLGLTLLAVRQVRDE
jgi:hypothetical protein